MGKHNFKRVYYIYSHIVEIPTSKGANSYTLKIFKNMGITLQQIVK